MWLFNFQKIFGARYYVLWFALNLFGFQLGSFDFARSSTHGAFPSWNGRGYGGVTLSLVFLLKLFWKENFSKVTMCPTSITLIRQVLNVPYQHFNSRACYFLSINVWKFYSKNFSNFSCKYVETSFILWGIGLNLRIVPTMDIGASYWFLFVWGKARMPHWKYYISSFIIERIFKSVFAAYLVSKKPFPT
jgi:hypothetical protein